MYRNSRVAIPYAMDVGSTSATLATVRCVGINQIRCMLHA